LIVAKKLETDRETQKYEGSLPGGGKKKGGGTVEQGKLKRKSKKETKSILSGKEPESYKGKEKAKFSPTSGA